MLFPSTTMVKLSFTKTWCYGEKHSTYCAATDARKIAVHSTLVQWVDGKTSTLHKVFYPALKVDFRNSQTLWPWSWTKLGALHPGGILSKFCFPFKWWSVTETSPKLFKGPLSWFLQRPAMFQTPSWSDPPNFGPEPTFRSFLTLPLPRCHAFIH